MTGVIDRMGIAHIAGGWSLARGRSRVGDAGLPDGLGHLHHTQAARDDNVSALR